MKCFYHAADLDGHCSGAIVKYFNPGFTLFPINYGEPFPWDQIEPAEEVVMVDFSLQPFSQMIMLNRRSRLVWIDHHKSAMEEFKESGEYIAGSVQVGKAACELAWEYFSPGTGMAPRVVRLLGRYDVWDHEDPRVLPFQYGMRLTETDPQSDKAMAMWEKFFENDFLCDTVHHDGEVIIRYEAMVSEKYCKSYAFEALMPTHPPNTSCKYHSGRLPAICLNRGMTNSKTFDSRYDPKKHDLMITFCRLPSARWTVSLYSDKKNVDCGAIAKRYAGGGHKGAAGFQCEELPFELPFID